MARTTRNRKQDSKSFNAGFKAVDSTLNGVARVTGGVAAAARGTSDVVTGFFGGMAHAVKARKKSGATPVEPKAQAKRTAAKPAATKRTAAKSTAAKPAATKSRVRKTPAEE